MMNDKKGLVEKYIVLKTQGKGPFTAEVILKAGGPEEEVHGKGAYMKTTPCFVLSPEKDDDYGAASRSALVAYATLIRKRNPYLAEDLLDWLGKIAHKGG